MSLCHHPPPRGGETGAGRPKYFHPLTPKGTSGLVAGVSPNVPVTCAWAKGELRGGAGPGEVPKCPFVPRGWWQPWGAVGGVLSVLVPKRKGMQGVPCLLSLKRDKFLCLVPQEKGVLGGDPQISPGGAGGVHEGPQISLIQDRGS